MQKKTQIKKLITLTLDIKIFLNLSSIVSNLIISYYTIHFIDPKHRQDLFDKIL